MQRPRRPEKEIGLGHFTHQGKSFCDELATAASADLNKQNWLVDKIYEDANV
jgi:hypothetical protein